MTWVRRRSEGLQPNPGLSGGPRQRSIKAQGQIPGAEPADSNATVYLVDQDSRFNFDGLSWDIPVSINGDSVTAVHLHPDTDHYTL